jgi:cbb3-type cytochrome oxidase subunit 3
MYKDVLRAIEGIDIFPVISLILFFSFFIGLIYYVMKTDKEKWDRAAQLPLNSEAGVLDTHRSNDETSIDSKN